MKERLQKLPKILLALMIQGLALLLVWLIFMLVSVVITPAYPFWVVVIVQGVLAAFLSCRLGLPCWWRWIQFGIPVGLYFGVTLGFDPLWALVAAVLLWLVFANTAKDRVPLYLTNATTREALKKLIGRKKKLTFLDLGCGLGGNVVYMAQQRGVMRADGVETAPIPYFVSKLNTLLRGGQVFAMDMWKTDLSYYDIVYAFLSPEPMPKLWEKVMNEMVAGSVFVSNSFAVPDVEPTEVWELDDGRKTKLFIYRIEEK